MQEEKQKLLAEQRAQRLQAREIKALEKAQQIAQKYVSHKDHLARQKPLQVSQIIFNLPKSNIMVPIHKVAQTREIISEIEELKRSPTHQHPGLQKKLLGRLDTTQNSTLRNLRCRESECAPKPSETYSIVTWCGSCALWGLRKLLGYPKK